MTATRQDATAPVRRQPPLEELLANRRWVRRAHPFPHVVAQNVFVPARYEELDAEFHRIEQSHPEVFRRDMAGYDASGSLLDPYRDGPLGVFLSREWHDMLAALVGVGVDATGDVTGSLHHHEPGAASGWPHNDLNPGWFAGPAALPQEVRLTSDEPVDYHRGTSPPGVAARETVRAVSLLFYLANPPWQPGDGGETGLYRSPHDHGRPAVTVPPINNSLVLFECTPFSWHGFVSNHAKPRNSIVMWLHRTKDDAVNRWGEQSIVHW